MPPQTGGSPVCFFLLHQELLRGSAFYSSLYMQLLLAVLDRLPHGRGKLGKEMASL